MPFRGIMLTALLLVGCEQKLKVELDGVPPPQIEKNFERLPTILAGIQKTADVLLYEGLPSDFWEPELLEQELARKKTIKLHDYPLYEEQLALEGTDAEQFTALLSARNSFATYSAEKKCSGFHPDFCVEWKTNDGATQVLISLECSEVKMYGSKSQLHCDISRQAGEKLKQLLSHYRKNRPVATPSP